MLDKGLVDYLKVVSNSFVKIYLRTDSVGSPHEGPSSYYFTIGSVENFERKLESAQDELRIPSRERIAVTYTTEIDKFNLFMNFFPLILLGGLLLWSSGGFKGMKGGSGPGGIFNVGKSKGLFLF
jgi:AFG3 family protein